ncbi:DNA polymerase III subunit alpha [Flavisolibacter tropicus]|uniref:DNA-directed DNA polymerase n=1 Tax=Flavisolibacter tropicus TaxID=1492898 RepID=A0A172U018_9BACT|nr:DNA polymerase III subunit alpha [Flavisolibacter tropicus]ANE52660.1 DNA polymerase III subunit alpha [Flavisolibacter tropicus]
MYLNCKTFFSYRYGTFSTEALVKEAVEVGASALTLTNINNTSDLWDFYELCLEANIKPVLGAEIRNGDHFLYILLAKSTTGLLHINQFLTKHLQSKEPFPERPDLNADVWVIYPLGQLPPAQLKEQELIGIQPGEITKLYAIDVAHYPTKFVVRQPVTFKTKVHYNLHRLLRAIDHNILLSKQTAEQIAAPTEVFLSPTKILDAFRQHPQMITNTLRIIDTCNYEVDLASDKTKKVFSATLKDDRILLEKLALDGLRYRYGTGNREAEERVRKELQIIDKLGFNSYFLITWDVIRYAQSRGFYHVGRGSGANSIVAYCLQITDVNPIELDLYFERFLNPYRTSPPDFDIDFSWQDRDEVIDYIFKRYGEQHVALLGMYSTFQYNAILRELAKVFGLPKHEVDAIADNPDATLQDDKIQKLILFYGSLLQNFPNYTSIHPGGMLISEEPIYQYTALEMPPKGFATTQIDMFVAEKVGLYKLDILSQRGLGHIKDCIQLVRENKSISIDIHDVEKFKRDPQVADQIRRADTIGCFYIESPAMRQLLLKLRCDDYITLVAASSIIRPGVAQSGMMREYIYRFHNPDKFEYLHPKMKELLEETYGVMVFQEDVIKVAHHFAGLDMGEADVLRRAMSGKYRGRKEFDRIKEQFFTNCKELGHPDEIAKEVWRQIESFGGYSFSKAHSASFAVESYQSLFLKTYYPMEFMVAVINNFGGFYSTELYFHELRRAGAKIHAPCVNNSTELTDIHGREVYIGFIHIKSLQKETVGRLLQERSRHGSFLNLQDFIHRTGIGTEQLNILIRVGALRFTGKNKKELLWEANFLSKRVKEKDVVGTALFQDKPVEFKLPVLYHTPLEDALDEKELLGFYLCDPFSLVDADPKAFVPARQFKNHAGQSIEVLVYYITQKPVRTSKGQLMYFGTFIDSNGDWVDSVHFPDSAVKYRLTGQGFYHIKGKVVEEFGVYSIEVKWMQKIGIKQPAPL